MTVSELTKGLWIQQVPFRCSKSLSYEYPSNEVATFSMVDILFILFAVQVKAKVVHASFMKQLHWAGCFQGTSDHFLNFELHFHIWHADDTARLSAT